jgi:hypothetical protein
LFSQYMNERLLMALPHRQFVFTFPKLLRPYFRHNRQLFSEVSRLIFAILQQFYDKAARRPVRTGMVLAYQTSGEFLRWNPHFHCLVLEGGFDDRGKFVLIPLGDIQRMRFFLELTQHITPKGCQYIRRYGLYASHTKGTWSDKPHVVRLAPAGWKKQQQQQDQDVQTYEAEAVHCDSDQESRSTWARLIAQVYQVDPLVCPRCSAPMRILAVITEPEEVRKILRHLVKIGRSPPLAARLLASGYPTKSHSAVLGSAAPAQAPIPPPNPAIALPTRLSERFAPPLGRLAGC